MGHVIYYVNGVDFATYGVFVSASDGLLGAPAMKSAYTQDWNNYHGAIPYAVKRYYRPRTIRLQCFIHAATRPQFVESVQTFMRVWNANRASGQSRTDRLLVDVTPATAEPNKRVLAYEVSMDAAADISKRWHEGRNVGTFTLTLTEHEPCKRILCHNIADPTSVASFSLTTSKLLNIYWGDGKADFDVSGTVTKSHTYDAAGVYYIIICGCIDEISAFSILSNVRTTTKWNRLP